MNREELFKEMYDMTMHNLFCYSKDYLMTSPKQNYIKEWKREKEKADLLKELINEEKQKNYETDKKKNILETEEFE